LVLLYTQKNRKLSFKPGCTKSTAEAVLKRSLDLNINIIKSIPYSFIYIFKSLGLGFVVVFFNQFISMNTLDIINLIDDE